MSYVFNNWSDDASLHVRLGDANGVRGGSLWCLNASLLEDDIFNKKKWKIIIKYNRIRRE